jgi:hypothetical protein
VRRGQAIGTPGEGVAIAMTASRVLETYFICDIFLFRISEFRRNSATVRVHRAVHSIA